MPLNLKTRFYKKWIKISFFSIPMYALHSNQNFRHGQFKLRNDRFLCIFTASEKYYFIFFTCSDTEKSIIMVDIIQVSLLFKIDYLSIHNLLFLWLPNHESNGIFLSKTSWIMAPLSELQSYEFCEKLWKTNLEFAFTKYICNFST